jgi:hypothetical protein
MVRLGRINRSDSIQMPGSRSLSHPRTRAHDPVVAAAIPRWLWHAPAVSTNAQHTPVLFVVRSVSWSNSIRQWCSRPTLPWLGFLWWRRSRPPLLIVKYVGDGSAVVMRGTRRAPAVVSATPVPPLRSCTHCYAMLWRTWCCWSTPVSPPCSISIWPLYCTSVVAIKTAFALSPATMLFYESVIEL